MDALPYEILQLVATWLLPRQQCRLALTSRHCYHYLYNDLLRWHAKWRRISTPRCKHLIVNRGEISIIEVAETKKLVVYDYVHRRDLTIHFTTNFTKIENGNTIGDMHSFIVYYKDMTMFNGFYKYIHKDILITYIAMKTPLFSLPERVKNRINKYLSNEDFDCIKLTTYSAKYFY